MSRIHLRLIVLVIAGVIALASSFFETETPDRPDAPTDPVEVNIEQPTGQTPDTAAPESDSAHSNDLAKLNQGVLRGPEEVAIVQHLVEHGTLPSSFITKREADKLGWNPSEGNLRDVAPGKSIGGDRFFNREKELPDAPGRKYFEADLNYDGGRRGAERLVYSDDGLIYVTRDHYRSFTQVKTNQ